MTKGGDVPPLFGVVYLYKPRLSKDIYRILSHVEDHTKVQYGEVKVALLTRAVVVGMVVGGNSTL